MSRKSKSSRPTRALPASQGGPTSQACAQVNPLTSTGFQCRATVQPGGAEGGLLALLAPAGKKVSRPRLTEELSFLQRLQCLTKPTKDGQRQRQSGRATGTMIAEKGFLSMFKKQEDPKELVRKWQRQIRTEIRGVERQMLGACELLGLPGLSWGSFQPHWLFWSLLRRRRRAQCAQLPAASPQPPVPSAACRHSAGAEKGGEDDQGCGQA